MRNEETVDQIIMVDVSHYAMKSGAVVAIDGWDGNPNFFGWFKAKLQI